MSEPGTLDRAFRSIMQRMVQTGQAPFYTELAADLGVSPEEGRKVLHQLFSAGVPGWLYPNTDYIVSFAPFNNLPTQYRITIGGQQKWFAQWGFEALAVSWLFPGKIVRIDAPCLDCGESMRVEMKDGDVLETEPEGLVAYTSVPFRDWLKDIAYAWSTMLLFRSEEHVRQWSGYKTDTEEGIVRLPDMLDVFSGNLFTKRLEPDYFSHMSKYMAEMVKAFQKMGTFWQIPRK